ncbi:MAG: tryptophan synthase subunit beta [Chitinophagales bacterium]
MKKENTYTSPNSQGYYGKFGGAYIPEMLHRNVEELRTKYIDIIYEEGFQKEFRELLKDYAGRPTPLYFAKRLSEKYGTKIFLKREDLCHTGAHKINNTIGQILLAQRLGKKRIIAETGAGQHGVATATVCALKGVECIVYMGEKDIERQAPNVARMKMLGATVVPAVSGSRTLKDATNEAIRDWINNPNDTHYIIGSVVGPHPYPDMVTRFQSVISEEIRWQLKEKLGTHQAAQNEMNAETHQAASSGQMHLPTHVIACVGGGSNAAGAFYHFLDEPSVQLIAVEAAGLGIDSGYSAATTALGKPGILHGSKSLVMQTEDGQVVEPHSISAGLDYPGIGPLHAYLFESGRAKFLNVTDEEALAAAFELAKLEGIIPALESAHALASLSLLSLSEGKGGRTMDNKFNNNANNSSLNITEQMKFTKDSVVVICLSGRGDKDLAAYMNKMEA